MEDRSNLNCYESEKSIKNYVGKCKSSRKKKKKDFYGKIKNVSAKTNSTPTNSTPALSRTNLLNNTAKIIVATQMFDGDQSPSIYWINITKTNMKQKTNCCK